MPPPEETLDSADRPAIVPASSPTVRPPPSGPRSGEYDEPGDRVATGRYSAEDHELVELTMPPPDELAAAIIEPVRPAPTAEGSFTKTPLVHLLVYILDQRLTGTATFFPPDGLSHDVYFEQGVASKIRTGAMIWPLDRVLVNMRLVDETRLVEALVEISKTKMLLGRHLVARGLVSRDDVIEALRVQLVHKLVSLCDLPAETKYAFYKDANLIKHYGGPELLGSAPLATIMAAVRASPPNPVAEATLARIAHVPLGFVPNTDLGPFELSREESAVCDLLRVKRMRRAELVSAGAAPELVVRRVIYALIITRYIELGGAHKPPVAFTPPARRTDRPSERASDTGHASIPGVVNPDVAPVPQPPPTPASPLPRPPQSPSAAAPARPAAAAGRVPAAVARGPVDIGARRTEIQIRAAAIDDETYFEVLGIGRAASTDEARNAYFALAKRWHPDRTPPELTEMKPLIATVFAKIGEAYATLGDGDKRAAYLKSLEGPGPAQAAAEEKQVERAVNAALEFQKAEALLKKNDLAGAERHVRVASDADPGQPEYLTLLAWVMALRRGDPKDLTPGTVSHHYDDIIKMFDEVLRGDPRYERALFYRGTLLKRSGKADKAIRDFRLCVELNERNIDALREVRLWEMRRREAKAEQSGQSGLFGKWFKR
jgi:curved DNA-binding protein CbpA